MHLICAIRFKNNIAVVKRPTKFIAFRKTETDICICFFCGVGKYLKFCITHNNRSVIIAFPIGAPSFCSFSHAETKMQH